MENNTEEKGLVKVTDNIFAKIRRFFMMILGKKQNSAIDVQNESANNNNNTNNKTNNDNTNNEAEANNSEQGKSGAQNTEENTEENTEISIQSVDGKLDIDAIVKKHESKVINMEETVEKNKESEANYEPKEEIERKLMNYYESIRKCI